jgi:Ca2+-binding RTX toxin-like protein
MFTMNATKNKLNGSPKSIVQKLTGWFSRKPATSRRPERRRQPAPLLESLEERTLMAASVFSASGILFIVGTDSADVALVTSAGARVQVRVQTEGTQPVQTTFDRSQLNLVAFYGLAGNDVLMNQTNLPTYARGGAGIDLLVAGLGDARLYGEEGGDLLVGGPGNDHIEASNGNDIVMAGEGNDSVTAGTGDDIVFGDGGDDTIAAEDGNDVVLGGQGSNVIDGGADDDFLVGGPVVDKIIGGVGDDVILGLAGMDWLYGEGGNDQILGGDGIDVLFGGDGNDTMDGGDGYDFLFGDAGTNQLYDSYGYRTGGELKTGNAVLELTARQTESPAANNFLAASVVDVMFAERERSLASAQSAASQSGAPSGIVGMMLGDTYGWATNHNIADLANFYRNHSHTTIMQQLNTELATIANWATSAP